MKTLLICPIACSGFSLTGITDCEPPELKYLYTACKQIDVSAAIYDGIIARRRFSTVSCQKRPDVVVILGYMLLETAKQRRLALTKRYLPHLVLRPDQPSP